jgi:hypothetical protein
MTHLEYAAYLAGDAAYAAAMEAYLLGVDLTWWRP